MAEIEACPAQQIRGKSLLVRSMPLAYKNAFDCCRFQARQQAEYDYFLLINNE